MLTVSITYSGTRQLRVLFRNLPQKFASPRASLPKHKIQDILYLHLRLVSPGKGNEPGLSGRRRTLRKEHFPGPPPPKPQLPIKDGSFPVLLAETLNFPLV